MVSIIIWIFSAIGGCMVGFFIYVLQQEIIRALKQSHRITTVIARINGYNKITYNNWFYQFKNEMFSYYSTISIECYTLDYNPKIKVKRRYRYGDY
jgi:phosphate/sulfate permease